MLLIEFIGFPGVGKTTVADALVFRLLSEGVFSLTRREYNENKRKVPRYKVLNDCIRLFALMPNIVFLWYLTLKVSNQGWIKWARWKSILEPWYLEGVECIVLDHGPIHNLIPYFFSNKMRSYSKAMSNMIENNRIKKPDVLIHIDSDFDLIVERLRKRNKEKGKFDAMEKEKLKNLFEKYSEVSFEMLKLCSKHSKIIKICGDEPLEDNVKIVYSKLEL